MLDRIGIVGASAIGCVVGGLLTKAGHDVTLIDQWPEHVEAMRQQGRPPCSTCAWFGANPSDAPTSRSR